MKRETPQENQDTSLGQPVDWREIAVLLAIGSALFALLVMFEGFEALNDFTRAHEAWQLDEVVMVVPVFALLASIFAIRRVAQSRRDSVRRSALEAELRHLASTNRITGLPNEFATVSAIAASISARKARSAGAVLVIMDDTRKQIEQRLGLGMGDEPSRALAAIVAKMLPSGSVLGSLDNDTMVVHAPNVTTVPAAERLVARLAGAMSAPLAVDYVSIVPEPRFGVHLAQAGDVNALVLVEKARRALDQARQKGDLGALVHFDPVFEHEQAMRARLFAKLRQALDTDSMTCQFHPIIDLRTGAVNSFEVLARWDAGADGVIGPAIFIPLLEQAGLIERFTESLLDKAVQAAQTWPKEVGISVNLSRAQLVDRQLSRRTFRSLQAAGIAPSRLEFELTEQSDLLQSADSRHAVANLRALGVKVTVDDFGVGHSNLTLLHEIDFDRVKVDRSLITRLVSSSKDRVIVEALVSLTSGLKKWLVAEGVEDQATADLLYKLGCTYAQGYHYARPMDAADTVSFLKKWQKQHTLRVLAA
jgi:predicted signal transduction protein with EAL and GGDEF domain